MLEIDIAHMQRCIVLANKGRYTARPNPVVGSVIVNNQHLIAEGWHHVYGQAHAEINALEQVGEAASGATLYVSLEPCSHQGKTGPCCDAIISAGIVRLVFGMFDPNPLVSGDGIKKIEAAGIEVIGPVLENECKELNLGFVKRMQQGLPYVRCKFAMSLDGRTAMANGESKWITGSEAREDVQRLRASSDALVTGVGTILADDPGLDVRLEGVSYKAPLRVIVDSHLRTPPEAKTFSLGGDVLLACANDGRATEYNQVQVQAFENENGQVNLRSLMEYLAQEKECNEVLLEAGPVLAGAMLKAGLIDEVITYIAPTLLGSDARPLFKLDGLVHMSDKIKLEIIDVEVLGKDCRMRSRVINE